MKDKKKKNIIILISAIAILLVAVVGATFAYFTASGGSTENSLVNVTTENVDAVSCTSSDVSLIVKAEDMGVSSGTSGGTAINPSNSTSNEDSNGTITCTAVKNSGSPTTCTYDIVYTPAQGKAFTTYSAANTGSLQELTLQGSSSTTTGTIASGKTSYAETDMYTMQSQTTLISSGSWSFSAAGSMTYTFTPTFYNYDFEQKDLADSSWGGTISVANLSCSPDGAVTPTESNYVYLTFNDGGSNDLNGDPIVYQNQSITSREIYHETHYNKRKNNTSIIESWDYHLDDSNGYSVPIYVVAELEDSDYWTIYNDDGNGLYPYSSCEDPYGNYSSDADNPGCYTSEVACNTALSGLSSAPGNNGTLSDYSCIRKQIVADSHIGFVITNQLAQDYPGMVAGTYLLRHNDSDNENKIKTIFDYANHPERCELDTGNNWHCGVSRYFIPDDENGNQQGTDFSVSVDNSYVSTSAFCACYTVGAAYCSCW